MWSLTVIFPVALMPNVFTGLYAFSVIIIFLLHIIRIINQCTVACENLFKFRKSNVLCIYAHMYRLIVVFCSIIRIIF
jgi:hypothetical protein